LWTIGAVARSSRLTVAALRLYHEAGVLVPARVDPLTRYRYYTEGQVSDALRIGLLRQAGVPLDDLRALAQGRLGFAEALDRQRDRLEREIGARRRALALLDALEPAESSGREGPAVVGRVVDAHLQVEEVDSLRVDAGWDTVAAATRRALIRLALAQRRAVGAVGSDPGAIFPLEPADRFGLRVFRAVAAPGPAPPGVERYRLTVGPALAVDVCADHALLPFAYRAVLTEADRRGLVPAGDVVERYLPAPGPTPCTRILLPLVTTTTRAATGPT
jgi:DNA-binding transcriptional MerR regulator